MNEKVLEMAVDLTKSAMSPATSGWVAIGPEKVVTFLEAVAKKLQELRDDHN